MKKKQKRNYSLPVLLGLMFMIIACGALYLALHIEIYHEPEPETVEEPQYMTTNIELAEAGGIPIIHNYVDVDGTRRPGEIREIRYITIHETDNRSEGADSAAHNTFLVGNDTDVTGWHYTVDAAVIYHNLPDNEIAWNAGDQRERYGGNMNGIGIELCVNIDGDFTQTVKNGAALTAALLDAYGLTPDDVRMHSDFMDKVCPHRLITEGRVEEFLELVRKDYQELQETKG